MTITSQQAIEVLNALLALDSDALSALVACRVLCTQDLADYPTCQVRWVRQEPAHFSLGFLGVLNKLFGVDETGYGPITAIIDPQSHKLLSFEATRVNQRDP